ncbi:MAG: nuclease-related domain-containing protein [Leptolyngbyaceae cyanobacterium]
MKPSLRKAGQNIRDLAMKRRLKAVMSFVSAVFLLVLPFILHHIFGTLLDQLSFSSAQASRRFEVPPLFYLMFVMASLGAIANGFYWWQRASHADQGARGEEDVAIALAGLTASGWQIEYNVRLGKGLGDADVVCRSPRQNAYAIDVKSHRGRVVTDGQQLYHMMGQPKYSFEKDFLKQVKRQALVLKQQRNWRFVTPILAFSQANVAASIRQVQGVYVVEKARLSALLKQLG